MECKLADHVAVVRCDTNAVVRHGIVVECSGGISSVRVMTAVPRSSDAPWEVTVTKMTMMEFYECGIACPCSVIALGYDGACYDPRATVQYAAWLQGKHMNWTAEDATLSFARDCKGGALRPFTTESSSYRHVLFTGVGGTAGGLCAAGLGSAPAVVHTAGAAATSIVLVTAAPWVLGVGVAAGALAGLLCSSWGKGRGAFPKSRFTLHVVPGRAWPNPSKGVAFGPRLPGQFYPPVDVYSTPTYEAVVVALRQHVKEASGSITGILRWCMADRCYREFGPNSGLLDPVTSIIAFITMPDDILYSHGPS